MDWKQSWSMRYRGSNAFRKLRAVVHRGSRRSVRSHSSAPLSFRRRCGSSPSSARVRALLRQLFTRFFVTAPVTGDWVRGDWVRRGGYRVSSGT